MRLCQRGRRADGAAKYARLDRELTNVRPGMGHRMARKDPLNPTQLRKQTREWLATHTIEDVREIAQDLENAGEDVDELLEALHELETAVSDQPSRRSRAQAHA